MKKITISVLLIALLLSALLVGCGETETSSSSAPADESVVSEPASEVASEEESSEEDGVKVMTYAEYIAAELDTEVVIEAYVQAKQAYWFNAETNIGNSTLYLQNADGAFLAYRAYCTQEEFDKLAVGTKVRVTGTKAEYKGEIELKEGCTFEIIEGDTFVAEATDITAIMSDAEALLAKQNLFVTVKGLTVAAKKDADGNDVAFLYNWNGSGTKGADLYFDVTDGTNTYTFTVESSLCNQESEVYAAVEALKVGDKIDVEGFLYWYDGAQPHVTKVAPAVVAAE